MWSIRIGDGAARLRGFLSQIQTFSTVFHIVINTQVSCLVSNSFLPYTMCIYRFVVRYVRYLYYIKKEIAEDCTLNAFLSYTMCILY